MEELAAKALEQGAIFAVLLLILVFLGKIIIPRWFLEMDSLEQAIHEHSKFDAQTHQALMLIMVEFSSRLQWHEAKAIPTIQGDDDAKVKAITESFERAQRGNDALRQDIKNIFIGWDGKEDRRTH